MDILNNFDNLFFSIIFRILIMQTRPQLSKCMTCCITNLQPLYTEPSFLPNLQARLLWVVFCLLFHKTGFFPNIQSTAKSLNSVHSLLGIPITSPVSDDSFAKESHQLPVNVVYILYRIWNQNQYTYIRISTCPYILERTLLLWHYIFKV